MMTIKAILDTLDGVDEPTRAFYAEQDGKHVLDVAKYTTAQIEGATGGLKAKVEELLGEKKTASQKAKEAEEAAAKAAEEAARKGGDIEALEKSWQEKLNKIQSDRDAENETLRSAVDRLTVGAKATEIAADLAVQGSAGVLERIVRDRLSTEMTDNGPIIRVLDAAGKPSASSLDDLKAELKADGALAPLLAATKASGGGAAGANGGAGKKSELLTKVPALADLPEK